MENGYPVSSSVAANTSHNPWETYPYTLEATTSLTTSRGSWARWTCRDTAVYCFYFPKQRYIGEFYRIFKFRALFELSVQPSNKESVLKRGFKNPAWRFTSLGTQPKKKKTPNHHQGDTLRCSTIYRQNNTTGRAALALQEYLNKTS